MNNLELMKRFLEPESVALVGVTRSTGDGSMNLLEVLLETGYQGRLYPVNPRVSEMLGRKVYPSVAALPDGIDMAVIITGRDTVPGLVRDCAEKGIKALVVVAQGFADAGEQGRAMQREIVALARQGGARILGPNTFGVINAFNRLTTAFLRIPLYEVPVGLICQSGFFFLCSPPLNPLLGKGIDLGNACDVGFVEALEYFEADPAIKVIAVHIEGTAQGRAFLEAATRAARKKPVLVLKTGRTQGGQRAVQSHTGALTGRDEVWDSALRQRGILRMESLDELSDLVRAFLCLPPLRGRRVGICTFTGGGGIIATDACSQYGLELARLSQGTLDRVSRISPRWLEVGNPVDMWQAVAIGGPPFTEAMTACLTAVASDPSVDALLFMGGAFSAWDGINPGPRKPRATVALHPQKPVACWLYGPRLPEVEAGFGPGDGVALFPSPERAVRALARLAQYYGSHQC